MPFVEEMLKNAKFRTGNVTKLVNQQATKAAIVAAFKSLAAKSKRGFAILCGSAAIWTLVRFYGMQTTYSFVTNVLVSVIVNFVFRKFFIFKG